MVAEQPGLTFEQIAAGRPRITGVNLMRWVLLGMSQTWLAQPRTLLVSVRAPSGNSGKVAAKLDDVAITVVPLIEQLEIVDDLVDRHRPVFLHCAN